MDHLTALKVFRHVAELGSFAAASRKLRLTPPAISKNVAQLEEHLGVRLINRTTRRMALTEEGALFLENVTRGLDTLQEAENSLSSAKSEPTGTLRVSAPMTVALTTLTDAIPGFLKQYPKLSLELNLDDRRVDIVREGYDMAIRGYSSLEDSSLIARKLGEMQHVLAAAPSYFEVNGKPQAPTDLANLEHVRFPYGGNADVWEFSKNGKIERISVKARYSVTSSLAIRDALLNGFGVSLIPFTYIRKDLEEGTLQTALNDWETSSILQYAVYPSRQYLSPKVRVFLDFLADHFGDKSLLQPVPPDYPGF